MSREPKIEENEIKTEVAQRVPPKDRCSSFQHYGYTRFFADVLEFIYQDTVKHNSTWM